MRRKVVIVSPATAESNNGNWQTARRWSRLLAADHAVRIVEHWTPARGAQEVAMLALHARRSAAAIEAWHQAHGPRGLAVVLTGTDLYRDITTDPLARRSLGLAQALVVLQPLGVQALPEALRPMAQVISPSTGIRRTLDKTGRSLRALMVGHLREEKSPQTLMQAATVLRGRHDIRIDHIGRALDAALGELACQTMTRCPGYRWLGGMSHEQTRRRIQRAHVLVHASRMEGGAHVVMEAICSGTPVLASRIDGNIGLLGADYAGYFPCGDVQALVALLQRCRDEPEFMQRLQAQCALRQSRFSPALERRALCQLIETLTASP